MLFCWLCFGCFKYMKVCVHAELYDVPALFTKNDSHADLSKISHHLEVAQKVRFFNREQIGENRLSLKCKNEKEKET